MIVGLITLVSCGNNAPKCDDKEVTETVLSILSENSKSLVDQYGRNSIIIDPKTAKIKNIMTPSADDELNSCGCEGTIETNESFLPGEGSVNYTAQKNSEGEIIVKVDNTGPFNTKL